MGNELSKDYFPELWHIITDNLHRILLISQLRDIILNTNRKGCQLILAAFSS
jgi:hypothetical protein